MSDEKPELENAIRLAIEAADAANSSAADIAEMKRQYKDASGKIDASRKSFLIFSFSLLGGVAVALGAVGFVAFKTISDLKTAYATQIEALTVFSESVAELRTTLSEVEMANGNLIEVLATQKEKTDNIGIQNQAQIDAMSAEIAAFRADASALQPQIANAVQDQITQQVTDMATEMRGMMADLQVAMSKMIATGFETLPVRTTPPAPTTVAKAPERTAPTKTSSTSSSRKSKTKRPAPRPATNPFKYP